MIIRQVKLIDRKEFAAETLDLKHKTFIVHILAFNVNSGDEVYPSKKAQITYLKADKAPTKGFSKCADFVDILLLKLTIKLFK